MPPDLYTPEERHRIVQGYQKPDGLTDVLKNASSCRACHEAYPDRHDLPLNPHGFQADYKVLWELTWRTILALRPVDVLHPIK